MPEQSTHWRPPFLVAGVALTVALGLSGCQRSNPGDVVVRLRNLSAEAVVLTTEEPGQFFFARTGNHQIPPWREGMCTPALGLDRGHIKLSVTGSSGTATTSYETTITPSAVQPAIAIEVQADGRVQFGVTIPDDTLPCTGGGI